MQFIKSTLSGAYLVQPERKEDDRGWFSRMYCRDEYAETGALPDWVQFNNSFTYKRGSIRGMHFQYEPHGEIKLVRCISGAVFDVVVDVREGSSTFLKWFSAELTAENRTMMYVPKGFAHGFQTLTDNCELFYAHSSSFAPGYEGAIRFDDPAINIGWPLKVNCVSDRDRSHPLITQNFKGFSTQ